MTSATTYHRGRRVLMELGVVILGVGIALAADSWRETYLESRVADQYRVLLREDISQNVSAIRDVRARFRAARVAADSLTHQASADPVGDMVVAGAMGLVRENLGSAVTYQELVASGQLALLPEAERRGVVGHYSQIGSLWEALRDLPRINDRVAELTGFYPIDFLAHGRTLTEVDRGRLSEALENDPGLIPDLRRLHAELVFAERLFDETLEAAELLLDVLGQ